MIQLPVCKCGHSYRDHLANYLNCLWEKVVHRRNGTIERHSCECKLYTPYDPNWKPKKLGRPRKNVK